MKEVSRRKERKDRKIAGKKGMKEGWKEGMEKERKEEKKVQKVGIKESWERRKEI